MNKKYKAAIIIGTFSTAAAAWSAATAAVPVIGPLLADTAGLTLITVALAYSLSALYGKNMDTASLTAFSAVVLGAIAGNLALKTGASLIPIFGSYFNAATTATLHAAIGWGIYKIYEDGTDLKDISKAYFQKYMERSETEGSFNHGKRISCVRQLLVFMATCGINVYIPHDFCHFKRALPHIFEVEELVSFFQK